MNAPDELTAPFAEAVVVALREMAAVAAGPCDSWGGAPGELAAVVPVATAAGPGFVALHFSATGANELARRVLAAAGLGDGDDATLNDCLGEVANVVAGQAKTLLHGTPYHFTLATPSVVSGGAAPEGDETLVLTFDSEVGRFTLRAHLPT